MFQSFLNNGTIGGREFKIHWVRVTIIKQRKMGFFFLIIKKKKIVPEVNMKLGIESLWNTPNEKRKKEREG